MSGLNQTFHIEVPAETDFRKRFFYTEDSTGLPIDLTGYRAELQVKNETNFERSIFLTSEPGGGITFDPLLGIIDIKIGYQLTLEQGWSRGFYDLLIFTPQGDRIRFAKGFFSILPSMTSIVWSALPDISPGKVAPWPEPNNFNKAALSKPNEALEPPPPVPQVEVLEEVSDRSMFFRTNQRCPSTM